MDSKEWIDPGGIPNRDEIDRLAGEPLNEVHGFLEKRNLEPSDAWDILQETMLCAVENFHQFDPRKGRLEAWVIGIAANKLKDHRRTARLLRGLPARRKKEEPLTEENVPRRFEIPPAAAPENTLTTPCDGDDPGDGHDASADPSNPMKELLRERAKAKLRDALGRIKPPYRDVLVLHHCMQYSKEEISRILGRPQGTIAIQVQRGEARLRRILRREDVEDLL